MKYTILFVSIVALVWGARASADDMFHLKLTTIHKARMDKEFHKGRVEYHYNDIRHNRDGNELSDEMLGNIKSDARDIKVITVVNTLLTLSKEQPKIGTIQAEGKNQKITNITEIRKGLKSFHGQKIEIGVVTLKKSKSDVTNIVTIDGSLYTN